jgi:hypothetical protein
MIDGPFKPSFNPASRPLTKETLHALPVLDLGP